MPRVLIVEDNRNLALGLRSNLEYEGYETEVAGDGQNALLRARARSHDLILLDLMLPGLDGFRLLETIRREGVATPVLVLTARGDEADKVRGLRNGADDYVTKPFALRELLARVAALLRRSASRANRLQSPGGFGGVRVEPSTREVTLHGRPVASGPRSTSFFVPCSTEREGWRAERSCCGRCGATMRVFCSRTLDTHIGELRRKLEDDPTRPRIS